MRKKECIAMILAGGQGSRLGSLTKKIAKPAVPFGGKYRIIDFALSNCHNSGIDTVGVLTQYQPLALNRYIGQGSAWDLDRKDGGVFILPPYTREKNAEWYKGTADAIAQNISFIDFMNPLYVLVLSGDHIYTMDYSLMLEYHKVKKADTTIGVIEVPWGEASRFGILNTAENGRVIEFQEKPNNPCSNMASMGIYIFNWKFLKKMLEEDAKDATSSRDFGKDVIPRIISGGYRLFGYSYNGYWKDVGTIESYWQANMDLLADKPELATHNPDWPIFSVNPTRPAHYAGSGAKIAGSLISEGCTILGNVEQSVIFPGVYIGEGAIVRDSVIMSYAQVGRYTEVDRAIIGRRCIVDEGARIGLSAGGSEITIVDENRVVPRNAVVSPTGVILCAQVG